MENKQQKIDLNTVLRTQKYCMQCAAAMVIQQVDGEPRVACSNSSCDFVFWNNPVPVVAVLTEHLIDATTTGGFVLAHNVAWPPAKYSVITGFIEAYDVSLADAAKREVKEELNLDAIAYHYIGSYVSTRANQLILAYSVKARGDIALNAELDDYKKVSFEDLMPWLTETGQAVGDFITQHDNNLLTYKMYQ